MEGSLSKWTNVMKGWQFRWFVLDDNTGLLSYYTSKEKMRRGVRRGCIRLQGAVLGIDDEEDANFTITVDAKIFHLQAKDAEEREIWVRALEDAILKHARLRPGVYLPQYLTGGGGGTEQEPLLHFEQRLAQADVYLQMLIQQVTVLEENPELKEVAAKANEFLEAVKHSIVLLQIAKNTAFPAIGILNPVVLHYSDPEVQTGIEFGSECQESHHQHHQQQHQEGTPSSPTSPTLQALKNSVVVSSVVPATGMSPKRIINLAAARAPLSGIPGSMSTSASAVSALTQMSPSEKNPVFISYSSSDDEQDFFDASEDVYTEMIADDINSRLSGGIGGSGRISYESESEKENRMTNSNDLFEETGNTGKKEGSGLLENHQNENVGVCEGEGEGEGAGSGDMAMDEMSLLDPSIDYDALYDEDDPEDDLGSVENHGSVLSHLLSQVKIGMDLTKVVLPTFILERRSLLEMYADFFAHPDMFINISDALKPKDRIVAVLKWYLGAFHAGRRSEVAKKPYNPILGEIFKCYWNIPKNSDGSSGGGGGGNNRKESSTSSTSSDKNGNNETADPYYPWVEDQEALIYYGEQVSHHPPISGFYAEHIGKKISLSAHIWTKSKFLGLSVGVINIGHGCLTLHAPKGKSTREDYVFGFPNGYGRSILTIPWVELAGPVTISSTQTGFHVAIDFKAKPFFSGEKNKIIATVFGPEDKKKPFLTVEGEWNGLMSAKWADGRSETFIDVRTMPIIKKRTRPVAQQEYNESRRLWREVTAGLKFKDINKATNAKFQLEEKQRKEARERAAKNESWKPDKFYKAGDTWIFLEPLEQRTKLQQKSKNKHSN